MRARIGFNTNDFSHDMAVESTTRGRSFLFLAMAAVAVSGLDLDNAPTIYVPENGLVSVNPPLDPLRVGAWSTRTTHPFYMARWQDLLDHLGIRSTLENPYRFATKGEMLVACANAPLARRHVGETISCSSIAKARWQGRSPGHCGFCVPCLIRRAAIASAFGTDSTEYTIADLRAQRLNSRSPEGEHVRSFQAVARRVERRPALADILVHKAGPLSDYTATEIAQYADVFRRGIEEVAGLVRYVESAARMTRTIPARTFDFHCHVDLFSDPAAQVSYYEREQIVTLAVTTTPKAWCQNATWAARSRYVQPAVGLHPELMKERHGELALLERLMEETPFVGEVGLDGGPEHRKTFPLQRHAFRSILSVANRLGGRVLSIHSRGAADAVLTAIEDCTTPTRVIPILHWFSASPSAARRASTMGCYFSVNPRTLGHERGKSLVRALPMDRILTETDAPLVSLPKRSGESNGELATVDRLASIKGVEPGQMAAIIAANATRVFVFAGKNIQFEATPT